MGEKIIVAYRRQGLGDCLLQAANAWLHAKETESKLLIAWYNSLYIKQQDRNAFFNFFDLPDNIDGVEIIRQEKITTLVRLAIFTARIHSRIVNIKKKLGLKTNNRTNNTCQLSNNICIMYGCFEPNNHKLKIFFDSLRLRKNLHQKVKYFTKENFLEKKVIGVHVRYYPTNLPFSNHTKLWVIEEVALKRIQNKIKNAKRILGDDSIIFLSTDSLMVQKEIIQRFNNVVVYKTLLSRENREVEFHVEHGIKFGEETIIEMFLLSKCDLLVRYTGSWFSHYASLYVKVVD